MEGKSDAETKIIDSVSYIKMHENVKSIEDETKKLSATLSKKGYLENQLLDHLKTNDSSFIYYMSVGRKTNTLYIYTGNLSPNEKELLNINKDTIILATDAVEDFMNTNIGILEMKGYSLSSLQPHL